MNGCGLVKLSRNKSADARLARRRRTTDTAHQPAHQGGPLHL